MASFDYIGDVPQKTFHFQSVLLRFVVAIVYFAIPTRFWRAFKFGSLMLSGLVWRHSVSNDSRVYGSCCQTKCLLVFFLMWKKARIWYSRVKWHRDRKAIEKRPSDINHELDGSSYEVNGLWSAVDQWKATAGSRHAFRFKSRRLCTSFLFLFLQLFPTMSRPSFKERKKKEAPVSSFRLELLRLGSPYHPSSWIKVTGVCSAPVIPIVNVPEDSSL